DNAANGSATTNVLQGLKRSKIRPCPLQPPNIGLRGPFVDCLLCVGQFLHPRVNAEDLTRAALERATADSGRTGSVRGPGTGLVQLGRRACRGVCGPRIGTLAGSVGEWHFTAAALVERIQLANATFDVATSGSERSIGLLCRCGGAGSHRL